MHPLAAKILRTGLVGLGGSLIVSAAVNIFGAAQLIEPSDEAMIGLTRSELIRSFVASALVGAAMVYFGLRRWKQPPPRK